MNIKINQFIVKSDSNNFMVEELGNINSKDKETQEITVREGVVKTTYHPTLVYALKYIQNQCVKSEDVDSLDRVIQRMEAIQKQIIESARGGIVK